MKLKSGVYKIVNPLGEVYVGSSLWVKKRLNQHKNLKKDCTDSKLVRSLKNFGWDAHKVSVICLCENIVELRKWERYFQEFYDVLATGLNSSFVGTEDKEEVRGQEYRKNLAKGMAGKVGWIKGKKFTEDRLRRYRENLINVKRNSKMVFDLQTGIFYDSIQSAAHAKGLISCSLSFKLNKALKNKTSLVFC